MSTSLVVRQPGPLEVQPLDRPRAVDVRNAARLQHLRRAAEGTRTSWWNGSTVLDEIARQLGAEGFAVIDGFGGDEQAISLRATLERVLSQAHRGRMGSGGGGGAGSGGNVNIHGGGGNGHNSQAAGVGGASYFGGCQLNVHHSYTNNSHTAHSAFGTGGCGAYTTHGNTQNGRNGFCIVWEYA